MSDEVTDWVPVDACQLPRAEQPARLAEFEGVFAQRLVAVSRPRVDWLDLTFTADDGTADVLADLTEREGACCDFFDFALAGNGSTVLLTVRVPTAHVAVLDGIEGQARATSAAR